MSKHKGKIATFYQNYQVLIKFYVFLGYFLLLQFFVLHWDVSKKYIAEYFPAGIAHSSTALLNIVGVEATANKNFVTMPNRYTFQIVYHCAGIFAMIIYTAAVLAYPATILEKLLGLFIGIAALNTINVVRIASLGVVAMYRPDFFEVFHEWLWQGIFIIFVLFMWLVWRLKLVKSDLDIQAYQRRADEPETESQPEQ